MPPPARLTCLATPLACAALVAAFAFASYSAAVTKSATLDEPLHVASAFAAAHHHDFRLDPENPPLWKYGAMIAVRGDVVRINPADERWRLSVHGGAGAIFATQALYQTSGVDGAGLVNAARGPMVATGVALLVLLAAWAHKLAGPAAAVAACALLALDPTFLAHAAIVKNDVAMALMMLPLVIGLTSATGALKPWNVLLIALACGGAMSVKFSGLLWPVI